jgi:hypothetical protein
MEQHWKNFIFQLDLTLSNMFWHNYPAPKSLENLFVDVTEEVGRVGAGAAATGSK